MLPGCRSTGGGTTGWSADQSLVSSGRIEIVDEQTMRNRRTLGALINIRDRPADEFDGNRFFDGQLEDIIATPTAAGFATLVAARFVAGGAERARGLSKAPHQYYGIRLPTQVEDEPDILMAYRLTVAVMNRDMDAAKALVAVTVEDHQRAGNVLSCLIAMLVEAAPPPPQ